MSAPASGRRRFVFPLIVALLLLADGTGWGAARSGTAEPKEGEPGWTGRWAMKLELVTSSKLPLVGTDRTTTTSLLLVDLQRQGDRLVQTHRVCDAWMRSSAPVAPHIPAAFVRGLGVRRTSAEIRAEPAGWSYVADLGLEAIGYDPGLSVGALPRHASDPAVRDSDGDGAPGATVEIRVPVAGRARIFIVQRSHLVLTSRRTSRDRIEGGVGVRLLEQRTLGARPAMFGRTLALRPLAGESAFTLVRVADGTGCSDLARKDAARLFGEVG